MPRRSSRRPTVVIPVLLAAGAALYAALPDAPGVAAEPFPSGVPSAPGASGLIEGRPSRITDGDTLRFGEIRVRLHGINAPEMDTADGPRSRSALVEAIGSGSVRCEDTGQRSYNRIVAVCFDARGEDLAGRMVRSGWASDWLRYSRGRYALAGVEAWVLGRGIHRR